MHFQETGNSNQGMVQLYYDKYIAKPLRLPAVRLVETLEGRAGVALGLTEAALGFVVVFGSSGKNTTCPLARLKLSFPSIP